MAVSDQTNHQEHVRTCPIFYSVSNNVLSELFLVIYSEMSAISSFSEYYQYYYYESNQGESIFDFLELLIEHFL